jgi:Protein of unknown function (DUF4058)
MPSPFPGMNPYLESPEVWEMFHTHFIVEAHRRLAEAVQPQYEVQTESRLYIHEPSAEERRFFARADLSITGPERDSNSDVATIAPSANSISTVMETTKIRFLTIRGRADANVVTVIELLSPTNKRRGSDREQFLSKRSEILTSTSHYVEIDLLRCGPRLPFDHEVNGTYYAAVSRVEQRPAIGMWTWSLADPMPSIPVPLRGTDPDVFLDLKSVLDTVYDSARFPSRIYSQPFEPKLTAKEVKWAEKFVKRTVL